MVYCSKLEGQCTNPLIRFVPTSGLAVGQITRYPLVYKNYRIPVNCGLTFRVKMQVGSWCRGWDTNPRTHTGPDLKPGAFDHLSHPCNPCEIHQGLELNAHSTMFQPPSTNKVCPDLWSDSSKNLTALAMSLGEPDLFIGTFSITDAKCSNSQDAEIMAPGATQFTLISGARSPARLVISCLRPDLLDV